MTDEQQAGFDEETPDREKQTENGQPGKRDQCPDPPSRRAPPRPPQAPGRGMKHPLLSISSIGYHGVQ